AKVTSHPARGIEILDVRGTAYFPEVVFNPATGEFAAFLAPSPAQPDNTVVAKVVPRLTGSATDSYTLTIAFEVIGAAGEVLNVPEEEPNSLIFLRGDATGDGEVDIFDAMFIAQKIVGIRGLDTVNALNAASVKHDEAGDVINIFDAMYIAQYVVGIRDANYNLLGN
ncbi:dockerin type I repeat-containing protein, partial [Dehalococcoidia bacterium]|nr:dockerin type I repeat-containing protein [Dehalococcoidia bacterium]